MLEKLRIIFTIPELRQKILLTLFLLCIYRVGWQIPLPMIDQTQIASFGGGEGSTLSTFLERVSIFSASQLTQFTIFGLGIMPYISAAIILQLLGSVYPPLEQLKKEGEAGRKKINEYTRYLTVILCLFQSAALMWFVIMATGETGQNLTMARFENDSGELTFGWQITGILIMTSGSVFLMWLGEQIDEFGIGNGISLLIMAGIVAQMPGAMISLIQNASFELSGVFNGTVGIETFIALALLFVGVVLGIVYVTLAQRRIPTQSAKHVRGRRVYGGTRQYMPLRVNQAGVMPIIFASSLLMFPPLLMISMGSMMGDTIFGQIFTTIGDAFQNQASLLFNLVYIGMIYFFCYFWTAITFNPKEISENLKESGTFIPGYRPGKTTTNYLENVIERITYVGAGFLALVAVIPTMVSSLLEVNYMVASFYGGTGLLIAVSVAFDLVQKIDSHLIMRNYKGLLE
ncbi:MAG: preprotein translocase subunit SecY [Planctomycetaceae bacterium]|nr:preprotein translocase subunit SecY [Planctomycetaceae bacterium]MDG1808069.1 preprotein translocase subunit SecY [Pirellulaceae bacterium]MDG2102132.1 preprotein translocase subunit SecY [Pirellulaceae bacterium]